MALSAPQIAELRARLDPFAEEMTVPGNRPVVLDDLSCVWITLRGKLDLFVMRTRDGQLFGGRRHFASCEPGELVLARDYTRRGEDNVLLGVGTEDTEVLRSPTRRLLDLLEDPALGQHVAELYNGWIERLTQAVGSERRPRGYADLPWGRSIQLDQPALLGSSAGVSWVRFDPERMHLSGRAKDAARPPGFAPLTPQSWVLMTHGEVRAYGTVELLRADPAHQYFLHEYYEHVLRRVSAHAARTDAHRKLADYRAMESDGAQLALSLAGLARVGVPDDVGRDLLLKAPMVAAVERIARSLGLEMPAIPEQVLREAPRKQVEMLARLLRVRTRSVTLDERSGTDAASPLLAELRVGDRARPVALLPLSGEGYTLFDPADGSQRLVRHPRELDLAPTVHQFYRPLPARTLTLWDVASFSARGLGRDAGFVAAVGATAGAFGLITPLLTGQVFDFLIPEAERSALLQLMLVAAGLTLGGALFELARRLMVVRVEARVDTSLQPAVWDRLLNLPFPFFRRFNAGDLAVRAGGIDQIRQVVAGGTLSAVLAGVFSFWNVALLFHVDGALAVAGLGLSLLACMAAAITTLMALRYQRRVIEVDGKLEGLLLQVLTGLSKLRVSGTEERAFRVWAKLFEKKRDAEQSTVRAHNRFRALHASYPLLAAAVLYMLVTRDTQAGLSTGDFLAFSAAFGGLNRALLHMVDALMSGLSIVPLYERARPILETVPEIDEIKSSPGELSGALEVNHVTFRYDPEGPTVLDDISLSIEAGEFVGLVGASGSGKSTLLRLLLGLDEPESGGVYYDGRALNGLDAREVRQQIGTVLQSAQVMEGDIFRNIVGSTGLGLEDAQRAAEQAGLSDDIAEMPMGMHTLVSQGGGTLSGGQRQRLLIARALVAQPRLLFFDEATSALDNRTQAQVSAALEELNVTRIVVAHRLSTIRAADRIVVLEAGRIVESGSYEELMANQGPFTRLAQRQLL